VRRRKPRNPAQRLRTAVEVMPRRARIAMLRGIEDNEIIAGGYADKRLGGICPMLAAHRNGGRISLASFARAWDRFTGARDPRLATDRELCALRSYLELSLLRDEQDDESVASLARRIERERGAHPSTGHRRASDRNRTRELRRRRRWAWLIPTRRYDVFAERVAGAEQQRSEHRAAELLDDRVTPPRPRAGSLPSG
jgi:hypothetical protein